MTNLKIPGGLSGKVSIKNLMAFFMDGVFLPIGQNLLSGTKVFCWCSLNTPCKFHGLKYNWEIYVLNPTYFSSSKTKTHGNVSLFFLDHLWRFYFLLGEALTSMCHFSRLFVRPSIAHHFSGTVHHLIIIFGIHMCKMIISAGVFFFFFFKFWFFGLLGR